MEIQKIYQAIGQKIWSFFPTEASSISFYAHIYDIDDSLAFIHEYDYIEDRYMLIIGDRYLLI